MKDCKPRPGEKTDRTRKLTKPADKKKAVALIVTGSTEREVAKEMGCAQQSVSYLKAQNAELIEKEHQRFIDAVPTAVDTAITLMEEYNDKEKRKELSHVEKGHAHVHTMETLRSVGIYQSRGETKVLELTTINQDNRQINVVAASKEDIFEEVMKLAGSC